jgi:hypothetical protein
MVMENIIVAVKNHVNLITALVGVLWITTLLIVLLLLLLPTTSTIGILDR